MKKIILLSTLLFAWAFTAQAFCPVCTVAVIGGVGLSRWLGIDDTVTGIWVGGFLVSISAWTINWLQKKKYNFWGRDILTYIFYYLIVVAPLYYQEIIGHPLNKFWGVDKLILGLVIGSIFFFLAERFYQYLKKKNGGHAHFPMEKVVIPVGVLIILSLVFYFLTK